MQVAVVGGGINGLCSALLQQSGLSAAPLDLVRGSHLLLPAISRYGHRLEVRMPVAPAANISFTGRATF